jgi:hypothetical protein
MKETRRRIFQMIAALFGGTTVASALPSVRRPLPTGAEILKSFDARDWAKAFVAHVHQIPSIATDEETMSGWFANALMRGFDEAKQKAERLMRRPYAVPPVLWYENERGERWIPVSLDKLQSPDDSPEGFKYQRSQFPCELHDSCCTTRGQVMSGSSGWNEELVMALATTGYKLGEAILIVGNMCERCTNAAAYWYGLDWGYANGSIEWRRANTECEFCAPRKVSA